MGAPQAAAMGLVNRAQPSLNPDATEQEVRLGRYREQYVLPVFGGHNGAADEGAYFTATNPTPGTAIVYAITSTVLETTGYYFVIRNSDSAGGTAKRIYMDFIRMICAVTAVNATSMHYAFRLDTNMYSSGGSQLTPVNPNGDAGSGSNAQVYCGALTTVARTANARLVDRGVMRSVIPVVNDEWVFKFGGVEAPGTQTLGGTVALRMSIPVPPVIIAPGQSLGLQIWLPAHTTPASQHEICAGWWER